MQKTSALSISPSIRTAPVSSWIVGGLFGIVATTTAVITTQAIINGPQIRAAIEAEMARDIDQENRSVCGKLGAGSETSRFGECAAALDAVRTAHEQRKAEPFF